MDPSWIIAGCSVVTLVVGTMFSLYKFMARVRKDREEQQEQVRSSMRAQAEEALRVAREESRYERTLTMEANQKYHAALHQQIADLQEDLDNEQRAREILQRRYEELLAQKGNHGGR